MNSDKRRPFEDGGIARIAQHDFEDDADDAEAERVEPGIAAGEQRQRRAHRAEVRAEIDDVGDQQQRDHVHSTGADNGGAGCGRCPGRSPAR